MCIGCSKSSDAGDLVTLRLVPTPEGGAMVVVGSHAGAKGRGAHVHPNVSCVSRAVEGRLAKAFRRDVRVSAGELGEAIGAREAQRIEGLIATAIRTRKVAIGADASAEALEHGAIVVAAKDAGRVVDHQPFRGAREAGRLIFWGDRERLGSFTRRDSLAVLAVTAPSLVKALRHAHEVVSAFAPALVAAAR
jgi:predicted RNA-binding protein YlxR (DUF448 family)